jgi:succinyl-CoA synthetase beta subunit
MARKKISEFAAKRILYDFLEMPYAGISLDTKDQYFSDLLGGLEEGKKYVLKVDQAVKQRKKKGLLALNVTKETIQNELTRLQDMGYQYFIVEEMLDYEGVEEYYLAIERVREGKRVHYSTKGGIEIEENKESITTAILTDYSQYKDVASVLRIPVETLESIITAFDNYYFSFLEINPLAVKDDKFYFLDTAVEVDSEASFFVGNAWTKSDFREGGRANKTDEEKAIEELKETTPAALSYQVLNPNGSVFVLLSGGGASLVTADEIYQKGRGGDLANYGEYSGSPTEEETYMYVKNILTALLRSTSHKKSIIISGGVANFTDVRITFKGIIRALGEVSDQLQAQNVKIFVRRGGPHQEEGLALMKDFLEKNNLLGEIHGPELVLTDIVKPALDYVS